MKILVWPTLICTLLACEKTSSSSNKSEAETPAEIESCIDENGVITKEGDSLLCELNSANAAEGSCKISKAPKGFVVHCGDAKPIFVSEDDENQACKSTEGDLGTTISCPGIKDILIRKGKDGQSCEVTESDLGAEIKCPDQDPILVKHGEKGDPGDNGEDGVDGVGCVVDETSEGAIVTCGAEGNTVAIYHGEDGADSITEIIDPCGPHDGFDEIILLMSDKSYIAYFETNGKRFLVRLDPTKHAGRYVTTDTQKCFFRILDTGELVWP